MPVDFDAFAPSEEEVRSVTTGERARWSDLFGPHPEGGGPFGGRDNALHKLVAFLRAKSVPYEAGLLIADTFNRKYLKPSLDPAVVEEKMSRAWAQWADGGIDDLTPESLTTAKEERRKIRFLTFEEMEEEEARIGKQRWLIEGAIPAGGLVYLTGAPSGGKSWIALDLMRAAAQGGMWLGKYPCAQVPVIYIDEEMGVVRSKPRMVKLGITQNDAQWFRYTNKESVRVDDPVDMEQLRQMVEETKAGIVIIDTLTRVHGFDENDNSQMRRVYEKFQILMKAGATVVVLHHDRKGGQGMSSVGLDRSRGAGEVMASADMAFGVEKHSGYHKLVCTKSRLLANDEAAGCDFEIADNEDRTSTVLRPVDAQEKSERKLDASSAEILTLLRDRGPLNTRAICEALEGRTETVVAALSRMVDQGLLNVEPGANRAKFYSPAPGSQF